VSDAVDDDIAACADAVRRGDPSRFRATMAAPVAARAVLFPMYAFNLEVARAPWVTSEPMIAEMRMQWWRDALDEIATGAKVRRHMVATPLARILDAEGAGLLDALIAARRDDIGGAPCPGEAGFGPYIAATSGNLMLAAARALGPAEPDTVLDAGFAVGVANWLRAVPALDAAGRRMQSAEGEAAVREVARDALRRLARARANRARVSRAAGPALLPLWEAGPILRRAARDPSAVRAGRLDPGPARARLALMARALSGRW